MSRRKDFRVRLILPGIALVALGMAMSLVSCSTQTFDRMECTTDSVCQSSFGSSSTCDPDGYCTDERVSCTDSAQCVERFGEAAVCEAGSCTDPRIRCTENAECRDGADYGDICMDSVCTPTPVHPRCELTYPADLFDRPGDFGLVIGNLMDRSLDTHVAREQSAQLAVVQANDNGGIGDGDIGLIRCTIEANTEFDMLTREEAAVDAAKWLVDVWGVPAIVGPAASGDTQAVFDAIRESGTVITSPSATSPMLTTLDVLLPTDAEPGLLWRTAPPDSLQGAVIAEDFEARGVTSVSIVAEMGSYGEGLVDVFRGAFGGSVASTGLFNSGNSSQRDEAINSATADNVLFVSSQTTDAVALVRFAATSAYDGKSVFLTDSAGTAEVASEVAVSLRGRLRGTRPAPIDNAVYDNFVGAYASAYGGDDVTQFTFTAQAFDAAWVTIYGAGWALAQDDSISGIGIARGMRRISRGTELSFVGSSWPSARTAFAEGRSVNVSGASGALDFDPLTEEIDAPIEVWVVNSCGPTSVVEPVAVGEAQMECS